MKIESVIIFFLCIIISFLLSNRHLLEVINKNTAFFISNIFVSNTKLKLARNQANAKQHPESELLLFENYSNFSSTLS